MSDHYKLAVTFCAENSEELISAAYDGLTGYCLECGAQAENACEPDARQYRCTTCGEMAVYGAAEILLMGS